ncbi:hypothetical protein IGJ83_001913 [Enterococcus pernyi]|nr:hypothetical protein [Enterococcus faecium]
MIYNPIFANSASDPNLRLEYLKVILNFISDIIKSLSWTIFFLIILLFLFKNKESVKKMIPYFYDLLRRTKSVKFGNTSISFSEELEHIEEIKNENKKSDSEENTSTVGDKGVGNPMIDKWFSPSDEFDSLARLRPDFAILDSWQSIERMLRYSSDDTMDNTPIFTIISNLSKQEMISRNQINFLKELSNLRNLVVHNASIPLTYDDAWRYRQNCIEIVQIINILPNNKH